MTPQEIQIGSVVKFTYTNSKSEVSTRVVFINRIEFSESDWFPPQCCIYGWEFSKEQYRTFPVASIDPKSFIQLARPAK